MQNPMMGQIKQMMNMVRMSRNPQMALNQLIQSNSQMKQVMDFVKASGKTPEQAFTALAQQMNVDPQEFLNELKSGL